MAVTRSPPTCPFVTPRTADHIYGKLRVDSRVALTLYAQDGGLVWSRESGSAFAAPDQPPVLGVEGEGDAAVHPELPVDMVGRPWGHKGASWRRPSHGHSLIAPATGSIGLRRHAASNAER